MLAQVKLFADGLFKDLTPDEAEAFVRRCEKKTYRDQTVLFQELTVRQPGDAIGWSSLVPPYQYAFSGVCKGKVTLLQIDRAAMLEVFASNYHLGYVFMRNIAALTGDRLQRVQEKLARVMCDEAINGW